MQIRPILLVFALAAMLLGLGSPLAACAAERPSAPCCPGGQHHPCGGDHGLPAASGCQTDATCLVPSATPAIVAAAVGEHAFAAAQAGSGSDASIDAAMAPPPPTPPLLHWRPPRPPDVAAAAAARTWLLTARLRL